MSKKDGTFIPRVGYTRAPRTGRFVRTPSTRQSAATYRQALEITEEVRRSSPQAKRMLEALCNPAFAFWRHAYKPVPVDVGVATQCDYCFGYPDDPRHL